MVALLLDCSTAALPTPEMVSSNWKPFELKMLDFSDRARTGTSILASVVDWMSPLLEPQNQQVDEFYSIRKHQTPHFQSLKSLIVWSGIWKIMKNVEVGRNGFLTRPKKKVIMFQKIPTGYFTTLWPQSPRIDISGLHNIGRWTCFKAQNVPSGSCMSWKLLLQLIILFAASPPLSLQPCQTCSP